MATVEAGRGNLSHMALHGLDQNIAMEVFGGSPLFFQNPPREGRTGTHIMIGPSATGRWWTIVIVLVDDAAGIWRPITGWPSTNKETKLWHDAS